MWPSLRDFLNVPDELSGKGVRIAVIDGDFPNHPDITTNDRRTVYKVMVMESDPVPRVFNAEPGPWLGGAHGLWAAAAASGSGAESGGLYRGVAPEADLFLVAQYFQEHKRDPDGWREAHIRSLEWVRDNWKKYWIRGVLSARASSIDSSLLPWQTDQVRVLCEELATEGVLVVSATGNTTDRTALLAEATSPSVLSVGGVVIPSDGDSSQAKPFPCCRGNTYEGKWIPEILAPAENIVLPHGTDDEVDQHSNGKVDDLPRRHALRLGTSYAGPIVLGAAACLWESKPDWSAQQVKLALIASSTNRPQWTDLRAGLVSIRDALDAKPMDIRSTTGDSGETVDTGTLEKSPLGTSPYTTWSALRSLSTPTRLGMMDDGDPTQVEATVLSFVGEPLPTDIRQPIRICLRHEDSRVRTAALCALATGPSELSTSEITDAITNESTSVKAATVFLLQHQPALWIECTTVLPNLFDDANLDVRYVSLQLARRIADPKLARAIVSRFEEDARLKRISNFAVRRQALESATGHRILTSQEYVHGEPFYSDVQRAAKVDLARRWNEWLDSTRFTDG